MIHQATSNLQLLDEQIFAERLASADERNFSGQLMRSARGDVRDHIVLLKNDHGPSYALSGVMQTSHFAGVTTVFGQWPSLKVSNSDQTTAAPCAFLPPAKEDCAHDNSSR